HLETNAFPRRLCFHRRALEKRRLVESRNVVGATRHRGAPHPAPETKTRLETTRGEAAPVVRPCQRRRDALHLPALLLWLGGFRKERICGRRSWIDKRTDACH